MLTEVRHPYSLPTSSFPAPPVYKDCGRILCSDGSEVSKNGIIYPCSLLARSVIDLACSSTLKISPAGETYALHTARLNK